MSKAFLFGNGGAIQRKTGAATFVNGTATVDVGFKPDLVIMKQAKNEGAYYVTSAPFCEDTRGTLACAGYDVTTDMSFVMSFTQTSNGFKATLYVWDGESYVLATAGPPITYTAVKYT